MNCCIRTILTEAKRMSSEKKRLFVRTAFFYAQKLSLDSEIDAKQSQNELYDSNNKVDNCFHNKNNFVD